MKKEKCLTKKDLENYDREKFERKLSIFSVIILISFVIGMTFYIGWTRGCHQARDYSGDKFGTRYYSCISDVGL